MASFEDQSGKSIIPEHLPPRIFSNPSDYIPLFDEASSINSDASETDALNDILATYLASLTNCEASLAGLRSKAEKCYHNLQEKCSSLDAKSTQFSTTNAKSSFIIALHRLTNTLKRCDDLYKRDVQKRTIARRTFQDEMLKFRSEHSKELADPKTQLVQAWMNTLNEGRIAFAKRDAKDLSGMAETGKGMVAEAVERVKGMSVSAEPNNLPTSTPERTSPETLTLHAGHTPPPPSGLTFMRRISDPEVVVSPTAYAGRTPPRVALSVETQGKVDAFLGRLKVLHEQDQMNQPFTDASIEGKGSGPARHEENIVVQERESEEAMEAIKADTQSKESGENATSNKTTSTNVEESTEAEEARNEKVSQMTAGIQFGKKIVLPYKHLPAARPFFIGLSPIVERLESIAGWAWSVVSGGNKRGRESVSEGKDRDIIEGERAPKRHHTVEYA